YSISLFFDRCFAIMRTKMCGPSAGANHIVVMQRINPGTTPICTRHRVPVVADEIVNQNYSRWYRCRDLENEPHLALGHHGKCPANSSGAYTFDVFGQGDKWSMKKSP